MVSFSNLTSYLVMNKVMTSLIVKALKNRPGHGCVPAPKFKDVSDTDAKWKRFGSTVSRKRRKRWASNLCGSG